MLWTCSRHFSARSGICHLPGSDEWKYDGLSDLHYHADSVFKDEFGSNWFAVSSSTPEEESVVQQKMSTHS